MSESLLREFVETIIRESTTFRDQDILRRLRLLGYTNFKPKSGLALSVLLDDGSVRARTAAMNAIEREFADREAVWDRTPTSSSSIGTVFIDDSKIFVKPSSRQGRSSGGLENEDSLRSEIDEILSDLEDPITVEFVTDRGKRFTVKNVIDAVDAGSDTKNRKKSDLNLITTTGIFPISIKKDNAMYWESADSYWGDKAADYIESLLSSEQIGMVDRGGYYSVVPNFAVKATEEERKDVVFGSDILGKGAVIKRTFSSRDFDFDPITATLTVNVSEIITKSSDLDGSPMDVWFFVRNDRTRSSVPGYKGIRVLATYEKRLNPNVLRVER